MSGQMTERYRLALIAHHARRLGQLLERPLPDFADYIMNVYDLNSGDLCNAAQEIENELNLNKEETK